MSKTPAIGILLALLGLLIFSVSVYGQPIEIPGSELVALLMQIKSSGANEIIALMALFMGIFSLFFTVAGVIIYKTVKRTLEDGLRDKIRDRILEADARSLIALSYCYYETFCSSRDLAPETSSVSISHAATQAHLAAQHIGKTRSTSDPSLVVRIKALALTNAAYYLAEKKRLIVDYELGPHSLISEQAVDLANAATPFVEALEEKRVVREVKWWDLVESRRYALFICEENPDINAAKKDIDRLTRDPGIPKKWRDEIRDEWLLRFESEDQEKPEDPEDPK